MKVLVIPTSEEERVFYLTVPEHTERIAQYTALRFTLSGAFVMLSDAGLGDAGNVMLRNWEGAERLFFKTSIPRNPRAERLLIAGGNKFEKIYGPVILCSVDRLKSGFQEYIGTPPASLQAHLDKLEEVVNGTE